MFDFYLRKPNQKATLHYQVKMYEERIMTPLALFTEDTLPLFTGQGEESSVCKFTLSSKGAEASNSQSGASNDSSFNTEVSSLGAETDS